LSYRGIVSASIPAQAAGLKGRSAEHRESAPEFSPRQPEPLLDLGGCLGFVLFDRLFKQPHDQGVERGLVFFRPAG